jgi:DNA-binding transcriptional LysR family regulator
MKLPIDGIQAFVRIAEAGSFHAAADSLGLTQTALTRRIQRLETFLGVTLLDRTTRSVRLSPVGLEFLPLATRLVADLTHGIERLRTTSRLSEGDVTIATLQSVAFRQLPLVVRAYIRRHPRNRVQYLERSGALVTEAVRKGEADFGIHIQQDPQPDLVEEQLSQSPFILLCNQSHELAGRREIAWRDLHPVDLITLGGASGNRRLVERQLAASGLEPRGRYVVESAPSAMALLAAGVGAAILPAATGGAAMSNLVEIPLVSPVIHRTISLIRRRNVSLTPAAQSFFSMLQEHFRGDGG